MSNYSGVEIAVIGMAGQFPGAKNIDEFWDNLRNGKESISFYSDEELLAEGIPQEVLDAPLFVKASAYIDNKEYFDADFFGYIPAESAIMDPQMRIFHENCWKALEDAGYDIRNNKETIGLFAGGAINNNWENYTSLANREDRVDEYAAANLSNIVYLCSRISYALNLRGPSVFLNTACSTSLVAVQKAAMSLLLRECNMALAGGVRINNTSRSGYVYKEGMIHSKDGHCRPFDEEASGTILGEGVGVVVLKRLKDAIADRDHIYAIIRGSAVNNDGHQKVSFAAPSVEGQYAAIARAIGMAKIEPASISYVEAHGTATKLGDSIETEALNLAFGRSEEKYCALGAVKSNIGHLDTAAGIAGFIKTVLALKHRQIPPSLHFRAPNPEINFDKGPFYVNASLKEWRSDKYPLRAGVSSFGIGGTNAHVILEEAPAPGASSGSRDCQLLVWSAQTAAALERNLDAFSEYLQKKEDIPLADIAYTLQVGRSPLEYRTALVCADRTDLLSQLAAPASAKKNATVSTKTRPLIIFMFSGQGSQYIGMCRDLYRDEEGFKTEADKCFEIVKDLSGKDLRSVIFSNEESGDGRQINETEFTQPALFIIEYALARLLMKWDIHPGMMIGHSIGEYVAACISGVFSLKDALWLVLKRGEWMQTTAPGAMLSISIPENKLKNLLQDQDDLSLAAVNSSESCVVSGKEASIDRFKTIVEQEGYIAKILRTSHAFHSSLMDEILDKFEMELNKVKMNAGKIPILSTLTAREVTDQEMGRPAYWVDQLRQTVRFSDSIKTLFTNKNAVFIEVGPGKVLSTLVRSNKFRRPDHKVVSLVKNSQERGSDLSHLLSGLGECWMDGVRPDWTAFYEKEFRRKVPLPGYSFEKKEFPVNVDALKILSDIVKKMAPDNRSAKNQDLSKWFYTPSWKLSPQGSKRTRPGKGETTLFFADECGISGELTQRYKENGENVVSVRIGNRFREVSSLLYEIDPGNEKDYQALFLRLSLYDLLPVRVVHAWSITRHDELEYSERGFEPFFYSVLETAKCCHKEGQGLCTHFVLLTNDLYHILDKGVSLAVKALSQGLLKVLSQEFPAMAATHIDIDGQQEMTEEFLDELYNGTHTEERGRVICLRHGRRWEQIFQSVPITVLPSAGQLSTEQPSTGLPSTSLPSGDDPFRQGGVYFITGGLGDLGFHIARTLVEGSKAAVILVGRTKLPARHQWDACLDSASEPFDIKTKIRRLRELEEKGGALYLDCNMADAGEVRRTLETAEASVGPVHGVIHAAGIIRGSSINPVTELTRADFECQFEGKITGLKVLKEVFQNKPLDFCLLTSSLSAVLGGLGFGAYGPANSFMDHYIRSLREQGGFDNWISMNLDGIDFNHEETTVINKKELFQCIRTVLTMKEFPQVLISTTDLHNRLDQWIYMDPGLQDATGKQTTEAPAAEDRIAEETPHSRVERQLLDLWRQFFGKPEIGVDDDFFSLGGDSLNVLTMIARMHKTMHIDVAPKEFFARSTIRELGGYIDSLRDSHLPVLQELSIQ